MLTIKHKNIRHYLIFYIFIHKNIDIQRSVEKMASAYSFLHFLLKFTLIDRSYVLVGNVRIDIRPSIFKLTIEYHGFFLQTSDIKN